MKICFITPYSPKEVSGVGKFVLELSKTLNKKGIETVIITKRVNNEKESKLDMMEIDYPKIRFLGGAILTLKTIDALLNMRKEIDIVCLQRPFIVTQSLLAMYCKRLGIPVVSVTHGGFPAYKTDIRASITRFIENTTFSRSEAVVFVDPKGKNLRTYKEGIIIENGVDTKHFQFDEKIREITRTNLGIHKEDFLIVFVGRITADKGIYELLSAMHALNTKKEDRIKALFIGSIYREEEAKLRGSIKKLGISENIIFAGVKDDVKPFYCAGDLFVLPSHDEGLPLTLLEAMACGLPVVASEVGGIPFVIENFKDGILVKPRDKGDLSKKIRWCVENPEKSKKIGENASKKARERYSLQRMTDEYLEIFKKLVDKG